VKGQQEVVVRSSIIAKVVAGVMPEAGYNKKSAGGGGRRTKREMKERIRSDDLTVRTTKHLAHMFCGACKMKLYDGRVLDSTEHRAHVRTVRMQKQAVHLRSTICRYISKCPRPRRTPPPATTTTTNASRPRTRHTPRPPHRCLLQVFAVAVLSAVYKSAKWQVLVLVPVQWLMHQTLVMPY
jgi:hypothetical protein